MTVKDVLKTVAMLINRDDVLKFLNDGYSANYDLVNEDVKILVNSYNIVADEIATEYFKLKTVEKIKSYNGVIKCSDFEKNPLAVLSVTNDKGDKIPCKILPSEILIEETEAIIEYTYTPDTKGLDDVSDYSSTPIKSRVIAYGVATEYLLIKGAFEEAMVWHEKYVSALKGSVVKSKIKKLKGRVWK